MARVFVYGTLRKGGRLHPHLGEEPKLISKGKIEGRLYDTGGFPAALFGRVGEDHNLRWTWVHGEVYDVSDEVLARLDMVEGYYPNSPDASLFKRVNRHVSLRDGRDAARCQMYEWNREYNDLPFIEHGDYMRYLKEKKERGNVEKER